MMFDPAMLSNSNHGQGENQQHYQTSNDMISNSNNYGGNKNSSMLAAANKYQQEMIEYDLSEKANSILKKNNYANRGGGGGNHYGQPVYDKAKNEQHDSNLKVQILPQDDWGAFDGGNTTAMTADFSDFNDDLATEDRRSLQYCTNMTNRYDEDTMSSKRRSTKSFAGSFKIFLRNYFGYMFTAFMFLVSFVTPILFIALPKLINWTRDNPVYTMSTCDIECEGLLIGIAFKLFILILGNWAIYLRRPRNSLPKLNELRALFVFFLILTTFSFWLFYGVRILDQQQQEQTNGLLPVPFDYFKNLQFSSTYVDVLLFIYILSVFIVELKHMRVEYLVTVYRSPDGEQKTYTLGRMSIQRASLWLLEQYYRDFNAYNPWLAQAHRKRAMQLAMSNVAADNGKKQRKGNMSATSSATNMEKSDNVSIATFKRKSSQQLMNANLSASDRLYEEYEFDKRLKKRQAKLVCVCEDAFAHVKRAQNLDPHNQQTQTNGEPTIMDPYETAHAIFATIARDLRRYLRVTRQQPFFTRDSIVAHLAQCVSYDISPRAFLERYIKGECLGVNEKALTTSYMQTTSSMPPPLSANFKLKTDQNWILICESVLYQNIEDELMIVLKQNEISLLCTFRRMPRLSLIEDILDPKRNKFLIKLNSETTV